MTRNINDIADRHEILRCVVGSTLHGIAIEGTDDTDEMGIFIEPPEHVIGIAGKLDTATFRTQPEGARSGPGDIDRVRHSLRKYMQLATKGNPNFLLLLFAPPEFVITDSLIATELRNLYFEIISKRAVHQTIGYLNGQLQRLEAGKGKRFPNRPELVEKYGYDTKYASHAARLALQAHEIATTGKLTLPMEPWAREYVLHVKTGGETKEDVIKEVKWWEERTLNALAISPLRNEPDLYVLNRWMIQVHQRYWGLPSGRFL